MCLSVSTYSQADFLVVLQAPMSNYYTNQTVSLERQHLKESMRDKKNILLRAGL